MTLKIPIVLAYYITPNTPKKFHNVDPSALYYKNFTTVIWAQITILKCASVCSVPYVRKLQP